jgi:predicted nucleotide-binding protein
MALPELRPHSCTLTPQDMQQGIKRLERRIAEVEAFDPRIVLPHDAEVAAEALHTSVDAALVQTFGHGTIEYNRYSGASTFSWSVHLGRPTPFSEILSGLIRCRSRSLALLRQAASFLKDELQSNSLGPQTDDSNSGDLARSPVRGKAFIVHGHDEAALQAVARFVEQLGLEAIILREQPDQGRTIIEKFEHYAGQVGFAVVLLTPDDVAASPPSPISAARARQNVIFELGYFAGKLGRGRACLLRKGDVEIPSDLYGVIYKDLDLGGGWKLELVKELKAAGLNFDANRVWS